MFELPFTNFIHFIQNTTNFSRTNRSNFFKMIRVERQIEGDIPTGNINFPRTGQKLIVTPINTYFWTRVPVSSWTKDPRGWVIRNDPCGRDYDRGINFGQKRNSYVFTHIILILRLLRILNLRPHFLTEGSSHVIEWAWEIFQSNLLKFDFRKD